MHMKPLLCILNLVTLAVAASHHAGVIYNNNVLNEAMAATAAAKDAALWPAYTPAYWQSVVDRVRREIYVSGFIGQQMQPTVAAHVQLPH